MIFSDELQSAIQELFFSRGRRFPRKRLSPRAQAFAVGRVVERSRYPFRESLYVAAWHERCARTVRQRVVVRAKAIGNHG
jgi:hypothetical protein